MKKQYVILGLLLGCLQFAQAQFTLDGEFRPRTEYLHGFGNLIPEASEPDFFTVTRARLNAGYSTESYKIYMSIQDILLWGENPQIVHSDINNKFDLFEAWAELQLGKGWSTKLGRQVLSYDDQRILGGLDWAQQGRNHDAALIKYAKDDFALDLALAFNQDNLGAAGNLYATTPLFSYKTMQMLHLNKKFGDFTGSLLAMNTGYQNGTPGVSNLQTFGTHLNYKKGAFGVTANAYIQTGERLGEIDVKGAYDLSLDLSYKASEKVSIGAGVEVISGNDAGAGETGAFFPLYGTNHKFNGLMDYFYVGNHANTIGLVDIHLGADFKLSETSNLSVNILNFSGEQELASGEKSLGTELDLVFAKKFNGYSLVLGYSQMFAADGMYELKGITKADAADGQNWAWAMLVIKPKFLN
ncbi:alginate export family protein [Mariniflexile litorale]|uniref:Alginate export family protein n=1 Tax=Mariniflexile litorale TaxID=3045158 RepID=A0AAU7EF50_9FLAO|nr:alginate export family protein [Mariniflexile sp. KMM 9835]MDQ8211833.1 alginate export family protein [Mariniflexile sp. KMM 9835]